jgi:hypothetical protein
MTNQKITLCVQNDWTTFLVNVQIGLFFIDFPYQINREF